MKNLKRNYWLGLMVGLGASQAILAIMYEYYVLASLVLIWPLLLPLICAMAGIFTYRKLGEKAPSTLVSVFILCILIAIPSFSPFVWASIKQEQHEKYMEREIPNFPTAILLEQKYGNGDGFDNAPGLLKKFRSSDDIKTIQEFYEQKLLSNGWIFVPGWENFEKTAFLTKQTGKYYWGVKIWSAKEETQLTEYEIVFSIYE